MGQRLIEIGNILKGYYPAAENGLGDDCFVNANGVVFKVCSWPDGKYVFMDYADNIEDARNGLFEEGALKRGIPMVRVRQDLLDPTSITRREMRNDVNIFMQSVMKEEPLDATFVDFDDDESW